MGPVFTRSAAALVGAMEVAREGEGLGCVVSLLVARGRIGGGSRLGVGRAGEQMLCESCVGLGSGSTGSAATR